MVRTTCLLVLLCFFNALEAKSQSKLSESTLLEIESSIQKHYPSHGAGVKVLLLQDNDVLFKKAYGQAVIEYRIPMKADSPFHLGSITKQFTAVAILMLVENGKLNLDEDIKELIPEYKQVKTTQITIRQLLTHTAGIPDYEGKNGYTHHGTEPDSFADLLNAFNDLPLEFTPGSNVRYSNSGYVLLGRIIEKVSGMTYHEFIQARIFDKAGMNQSRFNNYYDVIPGLSKGYEVNNNPPHNIVHGKAVKPSLFGDGGIISTLADMEKWYQALQSNLLISKESKITAWTSLKLADGRDTKNGLGWKVASLGKYTTVEHGGNNHGYENYIISVPEANLTVMVMSNLNLSYPGDLAERIIRIVLQEPTNDMKMISLSNKELDKFIGSYQYSDGEKRKIIRDSGHLYSERENGSKSKLIPFSSNKFYFEEAPGYWLRFEKDEASDKFLLFSENRSLPYIKAIKIN